MNEKASPELFDFFSNPEFDKCFFSGRNVSVNERISVIPEWVMDRYQLADKYMGMLNWNRVKYGELFLPCHPDTKKKIEDHERKVQRAFENGYDSIVKLNPDDIFLWMSKLLLGILYHDISYTKELARKRNRPFSLSPLLKRKYRDLHFMMQAIVSPVHWTERPYSLVIKKLQYSKDIFNFRDETKNQNFSLGMNGFGLIACLQDRGQNMGYHQHLLEKMGDTSLHAIQFEELCARFVYSNYLLKEHNGWNTVFENGSYVMSPADAEPVNEFANWDDKMFASVLEDYYKPWGIEPKDIYTAPDSPLSFLINESSNEFIQPREISLPT